MTPERAEADAAALLELRAHQVAVHVLTGRHGRDGLAIAVDDALADATTDDAAKLFAKALGVLVTHVAALRDVTVSYDLNGTPYSDAAERVAETVRAAIPGLMLLVEGGAA